VRVLQPGDIFGEASLLLNLATSPAQVVAINDSKINSIDGSYLDVLSQHDPALYIRFLMTLAYKIALKLDIVRAVVDVD